MMGALVYIEHCLKSPLFAGILCKLIEFIPYTIRVEIIIQPFLQISIFLILLPIFLIFILALIYVAHHGMELCEKPGYFDHDRVESLPAIIATIFLYLTIHPLGWYLTNREDLARRAKC